MLTLVCLTNVFSPPCIAHERGRAGGGWDDGKELNRYIICPVVT